ncbi:MAG: cysteine peptidase family C39 domain-containing protein [bacterium]
MRRMPFMAQLQPGSCGAAALAMVLARNDQPTSVEAIASELITTGPDGQPRIKTYQLAAFARRRGLLTTIARLEQPWKALYECQRANISVIINHRLDFDKPTGHFSVMTHFDPIAGEIRLNDPQRGPDTRWSLAEMTELWSPSVPNSQISGYIGVFCMQRPLGGVPGACNKCNSAEMNPEYFKCDKCNSLFEPLENHILGCLMPDCPDRLWQEIFCPECDRPWSKSRDRSSRLLALKRDDAPVKLITSPASKVAVTPQPITTPEDNQPSPPDAIPGESLKALAEAVQAIPLPDIFAVVSMASSQKSVLDELASFASNPASITSISNQWQTFNDEIAASNQLLEKSKNEISAKLKTEAEQISKAAETQMQSIKPDISNIPSIDLKISSESESSEADNEMAPDENKTPTKLPDANELVRRLMNRLKN